MAEYSHNEHRKRLREQYLRNPDAEMTDRAMLEMLLTYAIPRKDVKPIAYELLNEYKNIHNILNADINSLQNINGLGEASAIMLNLLGKIFTSIEEEKVIPPKTIKSATEAVDFIKNKIGSLPYEKVIIITLGVDNQVINTHDVSEGDGNHAYIDNQKLTRRVLNDNAHSVILAHNHPNGNLKPSASDKNTTVEVLGLMRKLNINLLDHIIVSKNDSYCFSQDMEYADYFDGKIKRM